MLSEQDQPPTESQPGRIEEGYQFFKYFMVLFVCLPSITCTCSRAVTIAAAATVVNISLYKSQDETFENE